MGNEKTKAKDQRPQAAAASQMWARAKPKQDSRESTRMDADGKQGKEESVGAD